MNISYKSGFVRNKAIFQPLVSDALKQDIISYAFNQLTLCYN